MTLWGCVHRGLRLVMLDPNEWAYVPYRVGLRLRGLDVTPASLEQAGLSGDRAKVHGASGGPDLRSVLRHLNVSSSDSILDLGAGKGSAMLTMAEFPFARIHGVELSPYLAGILRRNLDRAGIENAQVFCCDAADFPRLADYEFIYMYNPFPASVMEEVLKKLMNGVRSGGRTRTIIYRHPVDHELFRLSGLTCYQQFRFYALPYPAGYAADRTFNVYGCGGLGRESAVASDGPHRVR